MEGVFRLTDQEIDAIASRVLEKMKSSHSLQSIDGGGKMVADEPPKKWRRLQVGEVVCSIDWVNSKLNPPSDPPSGLGWHRVDASIGTSVCEDDPGIFARPVGDEPAKEAEPEHPACPKPDPGDGYRILGKDPLEQLQPGDEHKLVTGQWVESLDARTHRNQSKTLWYRRKIEPEPAEPEYRKPVLPADLGKCAEFSQDCIVWHRWKLCGCYRGAHDRAISWTAENAASIGFRHCRIKKDA
ncbi:MAG: hypothetical protein ACK5XN_21790 [Bacteroidota bacterium]